MHSVSQGALVPIASASPVALTFATQSYVAWWPAAALTRRHRFATALRGWPAEQVPISTRKLRGRLGHLSAKRVVSFWNVSTYGLNSVQINFCGLGSFCRLVAWPLIICPGSFVSVEIDL